MDYDKFEIKNTRENKESLLLLHDIVRTKNFDKLTKLRKRFYEINHYLQAKKILEYFAWHEVKEEKTYREAELFFLRMWNMWLSLGGLKE